MGDDDTITMWRPVGPKELELLRASGFRRWPPRLTEQPIFYPVTNRAYAEAITTKWNVKDFGEGHVTRFAVRRSFAERYDIQCVGGREDTEWWIPAEDLEELNDNIVGLIDVVESFYE